MNLTAGTLHRFITPIRISGPCYGLALGCGSLMDAAIVTWRNKTYYLGIGAPLPLQITAGDEQATVIGYRSAQSATAAEIAALCYAELYSLDDSCELAAFTGIRRIQIGGGKKYTALTTGTRVVIPGFGFRNWNIHVDNPSAGAVTYNIDGVGESSVAAETPNSEVLANGSITAGNDLQYTNHSDADEDFFDWYLLTLTGATADRDVYVHYQLGDT